MMTPQIPKMPLCPSSQPIYNTTLRCFITYTNQLSLICPSYEKEEKVCNVQFLCTKSAPQQKNWCRRKIPTRIKAGLACRKFASSFYLWEILPCKTIFSEFCLVSFAQSRKAPNRFIVLLRTKKVPFALLETCYPAGGILNTCLQAHTHHTRCKSAPHKLHLSSGHSVLTVHLDNRIAVFS